MPIKERPIIFSTESVRAIPDGRKTQTRRVKNPQPLSYCGFKYGIDEDGEWYELHHYNPQHPMVERIYPAKKICPFGVPGDRLWVREKWQMFVLDEISYRADRSIYDTNRWCSPLFMPRKFSRLTLEVTDVRCERLLSISAKDSLAEGYEAIGKYINEWDRLNAKRGFGWDTNPWVWVIEFKRVEKEEGGDAL